MRMVTKLTMGNVSATNATSGTQGGASAAQTMYEHLTEMVLTALDDQRELLFKVLINTKRKSCLMIEIRLNYYVRFVVNSGAMAHLIPFCLKIVIILNGKKNKV